MLRLYRRSLFRRVGQSQTHPHLDRNQRVRHSFGQSHRTNLHCRDIDSTIQIVAIGSREQITEDDVPIRIDDTIHADSLITGKVAKTDIRSAWYSAKILH